VKFVFELESLLIWKINLEELAQMRLADRVAALRAQEDKIRCLTKSRHSHAEDFTRRQKEGLRPDEYLLYSQFMEGSYRSLQVLEEQKKDLVRAVDEERDHLLILTREKKMLERLKEKKYKAFVTAVAKQEQNVLDERTVLRHPSRSRLQET
jgi:flagellar protein FliJ